MITENEMVDNTLYLLNAEKESGLENDISFFEFLTVLSFLYFKQCNVDFAVIETGLG